MWWCSPGGILAVPAEGWELFAWLAVARPDTPPLVAAYHLAREPRWLLLAAASFYHEHHIAATDLKELATHLQKIQTGLQRRPLLTRRPKLTRCLTKRTRHFVRAAEKPGGSREILRALQKLIADCCVCDSRHRPQKWAKILLKPTLIQQLAAVTMPDVAAMPEASPTSQVGATAQTSATSDVGVHADLGAMPAPAAIPAEKPRIEVPAAEFERRLQVEKLAALRQLAYGASHEINNPLANIAMRAEMLMRDEPQPDRLRKLTVIREQALRAHEMISDLMLFANPPRPQMQNFRISSIVRQVAEEMRPLAQLAHCQIELQLPEADETVGDPTQIAESIRALVQNSIEAQTAGAPIHVSAECTSAGLTRITVSDSGRGLTPPITRHMFDPFFSGREAGRGLGFGLTKAWRIAELHRGELKCVSGEPGQTVFEFSWPRCVVDARQAA